MTGERSRPWLLVATVCVASMACAAPAVAQPREPAVFFILSWQKLPALDPAALPADARSPYARRVRLEARMREELEARPRDHATLERLDGELRRVERRLRSILWRDRAQLGAPAWLLLGELIAAERVDAWSAEMDRAVELDGPEPALDLDSSVALWRHAAAMAESPATATATWARYLEAWALLQVRDDDEGKRVLSIVAASGQPELAAEARLRLGELAFNEGRYALAAEWYARALPSISHDLRPIAIYKRAWALVLSGRRAEAREVAERLGDDAPAEMRHELDEVLGPSR